MNSEINDFKIGLFVLAAIGLLLAGILGFGGARFFQRNFAAETYLAGNATGLDIGAPVTLRGVRVGKITNIGFSWSEHPQNSLGLVHIEFQILARAYPGQSAKEVERLIQAQVKQGLRARIETQGLVGTTFLSLEYLNPVENPPMPLHLQPRNIYIPSAPSQINQVLTSVEQALRKLSQVDFQQLSLSLNRDLAGADQLINHLNKIDFSQIGTNANVLLSQWQGISTNIGSLLTELHKTLQSSHLDQTSQQATTLMTQLEATLRQLDATLAQVDVGSINQTFESLRQTSAQLDGTLHDLKQYPSGFFFGSPPPPAKSVETPTR